MIKFKKYTESSILKDGSSYLVLLENGAITMVWYSLRKGIFCYDDHGHVVYEDIIMYSEVEVDNEH